MGRISKVLCCCFGSSAYEISPENDDNNFVILKCNNKVKNEQKEKLLQLQDVQVIEIRPKLQQENSDIQKRNQNSEELLKFHMSSENLTNFNNNDTDIQSEKCGISCNIAYQNNSFQKFFEFNKNDNCDDVNSDKHLQIKFKLKK